VPLGARASTLVVGDTGIRAEEGASKIVLFEAVMTGWYRSASSISACRLRSCG